MSSVRMNERVQVWPEAQMNADSFHKFVDEMVMYASARELCPIPLTQRALKHCVTAAVLAALPPAGNA